jgi:ABC-type Mn2+/Zn2+ transport system permease subunit
VGWLTDPLGDAFVVRAVLELLVVGAAGGALGCWVVLHRLSYSAESLAHAVLPGLVLAALTGMPLLLGGVLGLTAGALAIALASRVPGIGQDTATAVVVTTLFGLGVLLALSPQAPPRLSDLLFGDVLGTTTGDLVAATAIGAVVLVVLAVGHWQLSAVGFDRLTAPALGARPGVADAVLLVLLAAVLLVAVRALGNLLVVAVLVAPAAAARLVTRRMAPMMATSAGIAVLAGAAGILASYHLRIAAGAAVAAAMVVAYVVAAGATTLRR